MELFSKQTQSLLELLRKGYPSSSNTTLRSWVSTGRIEIDGKRASRANCIVRPGQRVCIGPRVKIVEGEIKILYEDNDLVVIDKPEGLLSVATDFDQTRSAHSLLKRRFHRPRVYPVHRLDRETSGLLVFAYTDNARKELKKLFEEHGVVRQYRAIVHGVLPEMEGTFRSYLKEDARFFVRSADQGKLAITHYRVLEKRRNKTLLTLHLETGRKNQIRVHLSEAGFPIVGDSKYGIETEKATRLYLHALELGFIHPVTQKNMHFYSSCPF